MRLPQRCQVLRQEIAIPEIAERNFMASSRDAPPAINSRQ